MLTFMLFAGIFTTSVQTPWTASLGREKDAGLSPPIDVTLDTDRGVLTIAPYDFWTNAMEYTYQEHFPGGTYTTCDLTACTTTTVPARTVNHVDTMDPVNFVSLLPIELPITGVLLGALGFGSVAHPMRSAGTSDGKPWYASHPSNVSARTYITRDSSGAIIDFDPSLNLGSTGSRVASAFVSATSIIPEPSSFLLLGLIALCGKLFPCAWRAIRN